MCGLYGFSGVPSKKTTGFIKELGLLNKSRGTDSTGIALVNRNTFHVLKNTIPSPAFFNNNEVIELLCRYRKNDYVTIMGHTRRKTTGDITPRNSHPFVEGNYIFAHNGMIRNYTELAEKHKNETLEVDSEIIGTLLNKGRTVEDTFNKLEGTFAIPYINVTEEDLLNVAVHSQVFSYAIRGKQLYYSSQLDHLKKALEKSTGFTFYTAESNKHYSFYLVGEEIVVAVKDFTAKEREPYVYNGYDVGKIWNGKEWVTPGINLDIPKEKSLTPRNVGKERATTFFYRGYSFNWITDRWYNPDLGTFRYQSDIVTYVDACGLGAN